MVVIDTNEAKLGSDKYGKSFPANSPFKECNLQIQDTTMQAHLQRDVKYHDTSTNLESSSNCKKEANPEHITQHLKHQKTDKELYPCQHCGAKLSSKDTLKNHLLIHSGQQKMTTCNICNIQIQQSSLPRHLMTHDSKTFPCPEVGCNKQFKDKSSVRRHLLTHTKDYKKECSLCHLVVMDLSQHMKIHDVNRKKYPCPECNKLFTKKAHVRRHMLNHTKEQKTECPICKMMCSNVKNHIFYVHGSNEKETCPECGKEFKHLHLHMRTTHADREKKLCLICDKEVFDLKTHLKTHDADREIFTCPECNKLLTSKESLTAHMKTHDRNREMFPCELCDKLFTSKSHIKKHMLIHIGQQKKTECPICKVKVQNIRSHILSVHKKIKSKCSICEKEVATSSLKTHLETHDLNRKMFPCPKCEKSFTSKSHVDRHMLSHSDEQKTRCTVCNKMIVNLRIHMLFVHDKQERQECPECGIKVKHLNLHMKSKHGDKKGKVPCHVCQKLLKPSSMKDHMLIHKGAQKSECPICKQMFSDVKNHVRYVHEKLEKECCPKCGLKVKRLKLHMTIHHGEEGKKTCEICNKQVLNLKEHMLIHGERSKTFSCHRCKSSFFNKRNLTRHIKLTHSSKEDIKPAALFNGANALMK